MSLNVDKEFIVSDMTDNQGYQYVDQVHYKFHISLSALKDFFPKKIIKTVR